MKQHRVPYSHHAVLRCLGIGRQHGFATPGITGNSSIAPEFLRLCRPRLIDGPEAMLYIETRGMMDGCMSACPPKRLR
jgi:hypothetical protein